MDRIQPGWLTFAVVVALAAAPAVAGEWRAGVERGVVVLEAGGKRAALVGTGGVPSGKLRAAVLDRLDPLLGIDPSNLMLAQAWWGLPPDAEVIAERIFAAAADLAPAVLRYGEVSLRDRVSGREDHCGPVDEVLGALSVEVEGRGAPTLLLFSPVDFDPRNTPARFLGRARPDQLLWPRRVQDRELFDIGPEIRAALAGSAPLEAELSCSTYGVVLPPSLLGNLVPDEFDLQDLVIGDLHLLGVPGTLDAAAAATLRADYAECTGGRVAVVSPANGHAGNLFSPESWERSRYRPLAARRGPVAGDFVLAPIFGRPRARNLVGPPSRGFLRIGEMLRPGLQSLRDDARRLIPPALRNLIPGADRWVLHGLSTALRPHHRLLDPAIQEDLRLFSVGADLPYDGLFLLTVLGRIGFPAPRTLDTEPLAPPAPHGGYRIQRVWFDSSEPSGHPANDRFPVEHYLPPGRARGAVVILPIWKGGVLLAERIVAAHLATRGIQAAILPLPWQMQRAPRGVGSGDWTVSADLVRTEAAMRQAQADVRTVADWLHTRADVKNGNLGVLGISLGAHVAAGAYRRDPRFLFGGFIMAGGDPASMVWSGSSVTRGMKRDLVAQGVTLGDLREWLAPLDPAGGPFTAHRRRGILMVNGTKDRVIPPENARLLHRSLGEPELLWFEEDHYSMVKRIEEILKAVDSRLEVIFGRE